MKWNNLKKIIKFKKELERITKYYKECTKK